MAIGNRYSKLRDDFGGDWIQYAEVDMAEATKSHPELALWDTANGKLLGLLSEEMQDAAKRKREATSDEERQKARLEEKSATIQYMKACKATGLERAQLVKIEVERQKVLGEVFTMLQMARMLNELMGIIKRHVPDSEVQNAIGKEVQRLAIGAGNGPDGPGLTNL